MSNGQYEVQPEAMRSTVGNVGGIIMQAMNVAMDLQSTVLNVAAFANIGNTVGSQNTAMQAQQVQALTSVLNLLQKINDLVKRSADDYEAADRDVAVGYGADHGQTPGSSSLWSAPTATQLANHAINDSVGVAGEPRSVGNVLGYLSDVGVGDLGSQPITDVRFDDASGFANWLDTSPENQARLGVIGVYSGDVRDFGDVPGGVQAGDIVVVEANNLPGGHHQVIGIAGNNGELYNHGIVTPEFHHGATVRVYRPMAF
jgi:uncharacterized protein YukE